MFSPANASGLPRYSAASIWSSDTASGRLSLAMAYSVSPARTSRRLPPAGRGDEAAATGVLARPVLDSAVRAGAGAAAGTSAAAAAAGGAATGDTTLPACAAIAASTADAALSGPGILGLAAATGGGGSAATGRLVTVAVPEGAAADDTAGGLTGAGPATDIGPATGAGAGAGAGAVATALPGEGGVATEAADRSALAGADERSARSGAALAPAPDSVP